MRFKKERKKLLKSSKYIELLTNIDLAIKENNDELVRLRVDCAMSHSWGNNVEQIYNVINKL